MTIQTASKTPTEAVPYEWDFSDVTDGPILLGSITKQTLVGVDPAAGALNIGTPTVFTTSVSAVVSGGNNNCSYQMICTVTDTANRVYQLAINTTTTTDAA